MAEDQRKAELTTELAQARARLTSNFGALRRELDFPGRVKGTVRKHPAVWLGGATLFGMLLSKLPARRKKIVVTTDGKPAKFAATAGRTGLLLGSLKIAFDLARPALAKWAGQRVADYMDGAQRSRRPPE
ncbi:MAG: hypothetical protein K8R23_16320 [Chthoniobacter sp.]|nr:hypothetical protein [Chthoniobacter sp.]